MEYALLQINLYRLGISEETVVWKEMDPNQFNSALKSGEIDAYCGDAALAGSAVMEGFGRIISYPYLDDLGYGNQVIVTTDPVIEQKRDWLQEILNTHYQVIDLAVPSQDEWLPKAEALGLNAEGIILEQDNYQWLWDLEEEYVMFTRNLCNYFYQMGEYEKMPDMNALFDFNFLDTINREHVQ